MIISGFEDWLPPAVRRDKDHEKHTVLLRLRFRRAVRFAVASAILLAAGIPGIAAGYDATGPAGLWLVAGGLAAFWGLVGSVVESAVALSWHRDHRKVRATGWRAGRVRDVKIERFHRRSTLSMLVEYDDGSRIRVRSDNADLNQAGVFRGPHPRVLVGGAARRMVVLSPAGPVLLQMKAETCRWKEEPAH